MARAQHSGGMLCFCRHCTTWRADAIIDAIIGAHLADCIPPVFYHAIAG